MNGVIKILLPLIILFGIIPGAMALQGENSPVVRAVIFYSPTCGHCHYVITEVLVPLVEEKGDQLQILAVDVSEQSGQVLFQNTVAHFSLPQDQIGVPFLVVGDVVLIGSKDIPEQFPGIVDIGLAAGGIDWPDIPNLQEAIPPEMAGSAPIQSPTAQPTPTPGSTTAPQDEPVEAAAMAEVDAQGRPTALPEQSDLSDQSGSTLDQAAETEFVDEKTVPPEDPVGFTLAAIVFTGMVLALVYVFRRLITGQSMVSFSNEGTERIGSSAAYPVVSLIGLAVSIYLGYVELTRAEAVCGPVGECNIVQSSDYATLLGIPIAVLGAVFYLAVIALWLAARYRFQPVGRMVPAWLLALTIAGTFFSIYLTYLELFVIRAVCAWCLTSAVTITLLMLLVIIRAESRTVNKHPRKPGKQLYSS